ncbi:S41 family peptidase [Pseudobutyrivibrio sp.]|uniref:S41 family peptidase n=1 Tax=Pseudobutyrivibrio sp. TaxID=2014367 RepID=UPI001DC7F0BE|nr:S41 family peptidase [Pseudobutyrivibrio sp.]MBE5911602.1 S41 family peptidase [Pseudobutyrivibrio sp.]
MERRIKMCEDIEEVSIEETVEKKSTKKWPIFLAAVLGIALGAAITLGILFAVGTVNKKSAVTSSTVGENAKLSSLIQLIKDYYYIDVDDETLQNGLYEGLFESLDDPYSEYYTEDEYDELMSTLSGNYAGIGALLQKNIETGEVNITKVYSDTPAEKAGLQAGDSIVSADEYLAVDMDLDEFVQHIRGEEGTSVALVISRDGEEMTITCERETIATPTVESKMLENNIGYIAVSQFTESTYDDFVEAYEDLESQGMTAVVFDMRNNGGGLVDSVVKILDYLLPEGTVVYTMDRNDYKVEYSSDADNYKDIPMAVLVNGNTASAAEIFTGAIRDFEYGTIIGTQTYGKGIVQSTIDLGDGTAVKITTSRYYTPSGECIHGKGITPDIVLEYEFLGGENEAYSIEYDNQLQKALEVLGE